jgi:hypothetical protein
MATLANVRSIHGRRLREEREEILQNLGEVESLKAPCPQCGAGRGLWCQGASLSVHTARAELRSQQLEEAHDCTSSAHS